MALPPMIQGRSGRHLSYFIRRDGGDWTEVTQADFIKAEEEAGFTRNHGDASEPATAGFSHFDLPGGHTLEGLLTINGEYPHRPLYRPLYPPAPEEED